MYSWHLPLSSFQLGARTGMHTHTHKHTQTHAHAHAHKHTSMHKHSTHTHILACTNIHMHMCTVGMHTTHTYTHTHMQNIHWCLHLVCLLAVLYVCLMCAQLSCMSVWCVLSSSNSSPFWNVLSSSVYCHFVQVPVVWCSCEWCVCTGACAAVLLWLRTYVACAYAFPIRFESVHVHTCAIAIVKKTDLSNNHPSWSKNAHCLGIPMSKDQVGASCSNVCMPASMASKLLYDSIFLSCLFLLFENLFSLILQKIAFCLFH